MLIANSTDTQKVIYLERGFYVRKSSVAREWADRGPLGMLEPVQELFNRPFFADGCYAGRLKLISHQHAQTDLTATAAGCLSLTSTGNLYCGRQDKIQVSLGACQYVT